MSRLVYVISSSKLKEFYEGTLTEPWRNGKVSSSDTIVTHSSLYILNVLRHFLQRPREERGGGGPFTALPMAWKRRGGGVVKIPQTVSLNLVRYPITEIC